MTAGSRQNFTKEVSESKLKFNEEHQSRDNPVLLRVRDGGKREVPRLALELLQELSAHINLRLWKLGS
jgi:hypothetical protein